MLSYVTAQKASLLARIRRLGRTLFGTLAMLSFGLWPFEARSQDLSDLFAKISTVSKDAGNAIKVVFFIAGICFIGMGIMKLIQAADRREPKGPGLTYIFLGFLLLGVYSLAKAGSQSLLGVEGGVTLDSD